MSFERLREKLIEIIMELFYYSDVDTIEYADLIDDIGMDSLSFISMIVKIEEVFHVIVPDDALVMENFRTVNNIEKIIKELEVE